MNASDIQVLDGEESDPSDPLAPLTLRERSAVTKMLNGESPTEALGKVGTSSPLAVAQFMARPLVRHALQSLAPSLPDTKHGARLLAPYALARSVSLMDGGSPSQALLAARDILALAGLSPVSRSESLHVSARDVIEALRMRADTESVGKLPKAPKRLGVRKGCAQNVTDGEFVELGGAGDGGADGGGG